MLFSKFVQLYRPETFSLEHFDQKDPLAKVAIWPEWQFGQRSFGPRDSLAGETFWQETLWPERQFVQSANSQSVTSQSITGQTVSMTKVSLGKVSPAKGSLWTKCHSGQSNPAKVSLVKVILNPFTHQLLSSQLEISYVI